MRVLGIFKPSTRRVLVIGIGGGGDVIGSIPLYLTLHRVGVRAYLASIPWERYIVDPEPGPLSLELFHGAVEVRDNYGVIYGLSYARHGKNLVIPQASRVATTLNEKVIVLDATKGFNGLYEGLKNVIEDYSIDVVVGVDVGGDVLAIGFEEELWSPLLDHLALSALYHVSINLGIDTYIGVFGLGCDGEIPLSKLEEYFSCLAISGYFKGAVALTIEDVMVLKEVFRNAITEASKCPIDVFKGFIGTHSIRGGTRKITLSLASLMTLIFDVEGVYKHSAIASHLVNTRSIDEAKERLNDLGVYTELDLEYDVKELQGRNSSSILDVLRLRSLRKQELKYRALSRRPHLP